MGWGLTSGSKSRYAPPISLGASIIMPYAGWILLLTCEDMGNHEKSSVHLPSTVSHFHTSHAFPKTFIAQFSTCLPSTTENAWGLSMASFSVIDCTVVGISYSFIICKESIHFHLFDFGLGHLTCFGQRQVSRCGIFVCCIHAEVKYVASFYLILNFSSVMRIADPRLEWPLHKSQNESHIEQRCS